MKLLEGQVVIVTGSARGIGGAVAKELAGHGAAVVVNYFQSQEPADALVGELASQGCKAIAVRAGVGHPDDVQALVQRAIDEFGQVDILVNNAGVNRDRTVRRMSVDEWQEGVNNDQDHPLL